MKEISPNVFVGGDEDYEKIKNDKSWVALRCAKYGPGGHQQTLEYHTLAAPEGENQYWVERIRLMSLNLLDLDDPDFVPVEAVQKGLDFIKDHVNDHKVLVACNSGISRGPTMGLMWLKTIGRMPYAFARAEMHYSAIYPKYSPGTGIRQFARMHWAALGNTGKL